MLGYLTGKPSQRWDRIQTGTILLLSYIALRKLPANGPARFQSISPKLARFTPWQMIVGTLTAVYVARHADLLLGLNAPFYPEKMYAHRYLPSYTRALWFLSSFEASAYTTSRVPIKPLRILLTALMMAYYLAHPSRAEAKNKLVRASINPMLMRESWEKGGHPILAFIAWLEEPRLGLKNHLTWTRSILQHGDCADGTTNVHVYFNGTSQQLRDQEAIILDFPGGGFVTMAPKHHADYLMCWAKQTGYPVVSVDYGKAPEFPFPYGMEECLDVYRRIVATKGACVGLSGKKMPRVVLAGDSAGGNFAASVMVRIIESPVYLPRPVGLVLIYPVLQIDLTLWLSVENRNLIESEFGNNGQPLPMSTESMTLSSHSCFFQDPIICPEYARAMPVMYVAKDHRLADKSCHDGSPLRAPDSVLVQFPPTLVVVGEKDVLLDDSLIFMSRLKRARTAHDARTREQDLMLVMSDVSHAFMHLQGLMPEIKTLVKLLSEQLKEMLEPTTKIPLETRPDLSRLSDESDTDSTSENSRPVRDGSASWGNASAYSVLDASQDDLMNVTSKNANGSDAAVAIAAADKYKIENGAPMVARKIVLTSEMARNWANTYTRDPVEVLNRRRSLVAKELEISV